MAEGNAYLADFNFISSLYKESVSADDLEKDMKTTLQEIEQHIKMARNVDAQFTHHLLSTTGQDFRAGELLIYISRMLRTATFAKEKILSFTQRFMLFDSIFRMSAYTGKVTEKRLNEWSEDKTHDVKQLKAKVEYQLRMLDRHISDIEEEFTRAEKRILNEKVENTSSFVNAFNRAVEKMEKTLLDAISQITNRDEQLQSGKASAEKRRCSSEDEPGPSYCKIQVLSDEEYMQRLIEENRDCQEDQEKGVETKKEQQGERQKEREEQLEQERENNRRKQEEEERRQREEEDRRKKEEEKRRKQEKEERRQREEEDRRRKEEERRRRQDEEERRQREEEERRRQEEERRRRQEEEERQRYIRELETELDELYRGRYLLPHRKIGDGEGTDVTCSFCGRFGRHFSDSCTDIVRGKERLDFILRRKMCRHCLGAHESKYCRADEKSCWYCDIVRNTALRFLIENDGHHRALCKIPDSRDRISERIRTVRDQIHEATHGQ